MDHFLASGALTGRTRDGVLALLGPDDSTKGTGWGQGHFQDWDLVYWLGPEPGLMSVDSE